MRFSTLALLGRLLGSAASYDDPQTIGPPLKVRPDASLCSVQLFHNASLHGYAQPVRSPYTPGCPGPWSKVILRVQGSVRGVQFDRFGGLWVGDVELLRTTTPEPDADGITWDIEKDVTRYADAFTRAGNATVAIPNVITSTYTGVLYVDAQLDFYTEAGLEQRARRHVRSLVDFSAEADPVNSQCIAGNSSTTGAVTLPAKNIGRMWIDIVASGHACEEFWYTNLPDGTPGASCGGGAFRELRAFVDDQFAGSAFPFPVLYTGGVNPFLWRPLTGIESFDVDAYRVDLSPFLGVLNDGESHDISVDVVGNDHQGGHWCIDPILVMDEDPTAKSFSGAAPELQGSKDPEVTVEHSNVTKDVSKIVTTASHRYEIVGTVTSDTGKMVKHRIAVDMSATNQNTLEPVAQLTDGSMRCDMTISSGPQGEAPQVVAKHSSHFPYSVLDYSAQDNTTFQINSTVNFAREEAREFAFGNGTANFSVHWKNDIASSAVYNRSLSNHSLVNVAANGGVESFQVGNSLSGLCYNRHAAQADFRKIVDSGPRDSCQWPERLSVCGLELCGGDSFSGNLTIWPTVPTCSRLQSRRSAAALSPEASFPAVRRPPHWVSVPLALQSAARPAQPPLVAVV